jgi:hypothetical protein
MTVTKDLRIAGLGGDDSIDFNPGILKVTGLTDINLGDGANIVDGFITTASFGKTLTYIGGADADTFRLDGTLLSVKGAVDLELFGGSNDVDITTANIAFSDTLKVAGGDGVNVVTLGDRVLSVAKATTITFGNGGNTMFFDAPQSSFGALTVTCTDNPLDIVALGRTDQVQFNGTKFAASGLVKFDLGAGQDFLNITSSALSLKAGLTILGGGDADYANLTADGTITGDVSIDLGGADDADQTIYLSGNSGLPGLLKITGALTLSSSSTDGINANSDSIYVYDVTVTKAVSATGGAVNSGIYFNNASTGSTFTVNSGAGDDDVQIETFGTFGPMTIAKTTSILLGDGADKLVVGFGDSNNLVRFLGAVSIDGGLDAQTDTVENLSGNFFGPGVPTPVPTNFP